MLIFVILSITEAYFSKLSQSQLRSHPYHYYSPISPTITVLCSPVSLSRPPQYRPLRPHRPLLSPLCRPCPVSCPPSPPCPPPKSCPLSCLLSPSPFSSPSPPSASPPQYYDDIRPISSSAPMLPSYLDRIPKSYQNNHEHQLSGNALLTNDIKHPAGLLHSSFAEKNATNVTFHTHLSIHLNTTNPNSVKLHPSDQQLIHPSDVIHENASIPSQRQSPHMVTIRDERLVEG
ncbi:unnamed protein product, partial [Onchocerca flexuosa]|uniref:Ovule protein n=1 Tax=Onchocerca flexuosa TaxID=387005 RepID=A0A183HJF8_9BILA